MLTAAVAEEKIFSPARQSEGGSLWMVLDLLPKKRGSMEQQLLALARRARARAVPLTYVFSGLPHPWLGEALAALGVRVHTLTFREDLRKTAQLTRLLLMARPRPALVHFHFVRAYSPLVMVARAMGARVIVTDHMTLRSGLGGPLRELYKAGRGLLLNHLVHRRVAVSRCVAASVRTAEHVALATQTIIEHGIDVRRFRDADGQSVRDELKAGKRPVVACVARLDEDKGVETLLAAHARVGRDALLVLAGDGPLRARLKAMAAQLELSDHLRLVGLRNDVERIYAAADVVVCPTHGELFPEAFGLSVVEAMAAGRPIVVSDSGAMPDLVAHGRYGLVVPRKDPVALAGAIGRLIDDRLLAARMGQAAQAHALERYAMSAWLANTVALYGSLAPSLAPLG
jgi:glycosyltransferase involved in cell wall biosynthesis